MTENEIENKDNKEETSEEIKKVSELKDFIEKKEGKLLQLAILMERLNLTDYLNLLHRPWRLMWTNFIAGVARGFGMLIGASVIVLLFFYALKGLVNLPVIGNFIAEVVKIVQSKLYSSF